MDNGNNRNNTTPKQINRKLDTHLLPPLLLAYISTFLDRANLSASLTSLEHSLAITQQQYALATTLFTIALSAFEIPSNIILKASGKPATYLAILTGACGALSIAEVFVVNAAGLIAVRTILGICEAGIFPG